jgi:hypothetical protein
MVAERFQMISRNEDESNPISRRATLAQVECPLRISAAVSRHQGAIANSGPCPRQRIVEKVASEKRRSGRESCIFVMCEFINTTGETIFQLSRVRRENFAGSAPKPMAVSEETHR